MIIAVNTRILLKNKLEGVGWFTYETLKRITQNHKEHKFIFIFDRPFSEEFIFSDNITPVVIGPQTRHPFLWQYWFEKSIPKVLSAHKADLFLSPDGYISLSTPVKTVAVIHDLNFEHYPNDLPYFVRRYFWKYFPDFAKRAERIATVSEFSKRDIIKCYGIDENKIDVVHNGANINYKPISDEIKKQVKEKYTSGKNYFLFVGALHPRKNIARLLLAFGKFKEQTGSDMKLVIAGNKKWWTSEMRDALNSIQQKNDVVFTGRLEINELTKLTASAFAVTFVPVFEGFGIPIIEAMNCDVPVITSLATSMPEVAGDAALLADPMNVDSIKDMMVKIYNEEELRNNLITRGRKRRENFSWDKTAELLWKTIEKVC